MGVGVVGHAMGVGVGVVGYWHHDHAIGVGLCRGVCGSCHGGSSVSWFHGSCHGVCVVGHWHRGHAVGVVGHQFWVMPWVWVALGFIFVVVS